VQLHPNRYYLLDINQRQPAHTKWRMAMDDLKTMRTQGKIGGRAYFGLRNAGVDCLSELDGWSLARIEAVPGIGKKAVRELLDLMREHGMTHPGAPPPRDPVQEVKALRARFSQEQLSLIACLLQEPHGRA
jgi:hypothetical protein